MPKEKPPTLTFESLRNEEVREQILSNGNGHFGNGKPKENKPSYIRELEVEDEKDTRTKMQETLDELAELFGDSAVTVKQKPDSEVTTVKLPGFAAPGVERRVRATRTMEQVVKTPDHSSFSIEQEIKLAEKDNLDSNLSAYLKRVASFPLLTPKEEQYYARKYWATRDDEYRNVLINHNLRLPVWQAKKFYTPYPFIDRIQSGNVGLITAVDKFDPDMVSRKPDGSESPIKFSTYATWWVRQAITRAIHDEGLIVRIPVHMGERIGKYLRTVRELTILLDYEPSDKEVAEVLRWDMEDIKQIKSFHAKSQIASLEREVIAKPSNPEGGSDLKSFVASKKVLNPEIEVTQSKYGAAVAQILYHSGLDFKEIDIIQKRFGLSTSEPMTLEEIGTQYQVTRERVRQIEDQAMFKLMKNPRAIKALKDLEQFIVENPIVVPEITLNS